MCMHALSVLVAMSLSVIQPQTHCENLIFMFYLFYQCRLERFVL